MTDRRLLTRESVDALKVDERGLLPMVAQDARLGSVLMLGWTNRVALMRSLATGELHFWSRSRGVLWRKGETSGNVLRLISLHADCDGDAVLALVEPAGPACHTGEATCFGDGATPTPQNIGDSLDALWRILEARNRGRPVGSYTTRLLEDENLRIKKLGEEAAELVLAVSRADPARIREEAADLVYHVLVALLASGVSLADLRTELGSRQK